MTDLDQRAGRITKAGRHLRESMELSIRIGDPLGILNRPGPRRIAVHRHPALVGGAHAVVGIPVWCRDDDVIDFPRMRTPGKSARRPGKR